LALLNCNGGKGGKKMQIHHYFDEIIFGYYRVRLCTRILICLCASVAVNAVGQEILPPSATQLPSSGRVVAGAAAINQHGATLDVKQSTQRAAIDWQAFSVGSQATVNFDLPNPNAVILNRVLGVSPSQIFGQINSNGNVFLSNAKGVYFSPTSSVDVGALVATTKNIGNSDFMAGRYDFVGDGDEGSIVNEGELRAKLEGYIALLAPEVRNDGIIIAELGVVALAAGDAISLNFDSDSQLMGVVVEPAKIKALIENKGAVYTPGGQIILTAKALGRLRSGVVRNSGTLEATGMRIKDGVIVLEASSDYIQTASGSLNAAGINGGDIRVNAVDDLVIDGTIEAQGSVGDGGRVILSAARVGLFGASTVDVSGEIGGGDIYVGGGFRGQDPAIDNATQVVVGTNAVLIADALNTGDGGDVVIWSNDSSTFAGAISARGGVLSGDGGMVEVSSKEYLDFTGGVDASAYSGHAGSLLLDPKNIIVELAGSVALEDVDTFADNPTADSKIDPSAITNITNAGTAVVLQANNDITINSSITTANNNVAANGGNGGELTLQAGRSITLNSSITSDNGDVTLIAQHQRQLCS
jgi:filamentous hemagglutinin family protein